MSHWRNRFRERANKMVQEYVASIPFDQRLYGQDIEGSIAIPLNSIVASK